MARLLLLGFFSVSLFLCGCAPKDPLDRKVKAATPEEFFNWWDRTREKFPDEQRAEISKVARYLRDSTPRLRSMQEGDRHDPFCKKINGITVRQLLILGYEESSWNLRTRVTLETGKLAQLVTAASESESAAVRSQAETLLRYTRDQIQNWNDTIAQNDRRIAELSPPAPKS